MSLTTTTRRIFGAAAPQTQPLPEEQPVTATSPSRIVVRTPSPARSPVYDGLLSCVSEMIEDAASAQQVATEVYKKVIAPLLAQFDQREPSVAPEKKPRTPAQLAGDVSSTASAVVYHYTNATKNSAVWHAHQEQIKTKDATYMGALVTIVPPNKKHPEYAHAYAQLDPLVGTSMTRRQFAEHVAAAFNVAAEKRYRLGL